MSGTRFLHRSASACVLLTCFLQGPRAEIVALPGTGSDTTSLKAAVNGRFLVGAAVSAALVNGRDSLAERLVRGHYTSVTSENAMKWKFIHPAAGAYAFEDADAYVAFAERYRLAPIGHTLVWHTGTPAWVFEDPSGKRRPREAVQAILQDHIASVVGRYRGRIHGWDVVNEVIGENGRLRSTPWLSSLGEDYVTTAFRLARRADPAAELYITEHGLEKPAQLAGMVRLLKRLADDGIHVDGVGLQAHYYLAEPDLAGLDTAITTLERLGYRVMLTELDVDVLPHYRGQAARVTAADRPSLNPFPRVLPDSVQARLADRYAEIFRVILRHPQTISRVTFWGVYDGSSWRNNFPIRGRTNYPLLFDRRGEPKAAYRATIAALSRHP